ncbi:MAG: hypothetical protein KDA51_13825 [Planctomycetales bacterium]|nr:hypothetical protein [Planctomycetales bacterium]MCA9182538.1 hypothetical protein [Planctomycetales bacterium]
MRSYLCALALAACMLSSTLAQPPWGGGGGPGGGSWGRGGGDDGGGRGGPGGGSWGRGGGDDGGGRGGRGGGRGGGDEGGGRSGFNPADMLRRFDRNGNNMIDPEEAQGPAQFFLQRLAQNNPEIDLKKPVPIDKLVGEMDRMRGGRGGESDAGEEAASDEPKLLVPDFSLKSEPEPIPGFGAGSSLFNVKVEDRDLKEAEDRMKRYDSNKDGQLSADELKSGRWSDDPLQYDRNRNGSLDKSELAVRYANRRVNEKAKEEAKNDSRSRRGGDSNGWNRSDNQTEDKNESAPRFGDAKSYRSMVTAKDKASGLPDFFARSDANADGQVTMNEFSSSWTQETLEEFQKWDLNRDGIILPRECVAALAGGARVSGMTASSAPAVGDATGKGSTASSGTAARSTPSVGSAEMDLAQRVVGKYDTNGDGQLTANEWEKMTIVPVGADSNGDGVLTVEEYAAFRSK